MCGDFCEQNSPSNSPYESPRSSFEINRRKAIECRTTKEGAREDVYTPSIAHGREGADMGFCPLIFGILLAWLENDMSKDQKDDQVMLMIEFSFVGRCSKCPDEFSICPEHGKRKKKTHAKGFRMLSSQILAFWKFYPTEEPRT
jgi:hypothetical protein